MSASVQTKIIIVDFRVDGLGLGGDIAASRVLLEVWHSRHFPCCLVPVFARRVDVAVVPSRRLEGLTGSFSDFGCIFGFFRFKFFHFFIITRCIVRRPREVWRILGGAFEYRQPICIVEFRAR